MRLRGTIEIYGMPLTATVNVRAARKGVSFCPQIGERGKWRAYQTVNGRNKHLGYYESEMDALEAVRQGRKLATRRARPERDGVYPIKRGAVTVWRATYLPAVGRRLHLGEYATRGAALLVRDVVARRCGGDVVVTDYEMPLAYVSNAVARSFIRDAVAQPTPADLAEYDRRVLGLSGIERAPVAPPVLQLPPEIWRQRQPSRLGRSPFDTTDDT